MRSRIIGSGTISITTFHTKKQIHGPVLVRRAAASQGAGLCQFIQRKQIPKGPPSRTARSRAKGRGTEQTIQTPNKTRQDKTKTKTIFYGPLLVRHAAVSLGGANQTKLQDYKLQTDKTFQDKFYASPSRNARSRARKGRTERQTYKNFLTRSFYKQANPSKFLCPYRTQPCRQEGERVKITSQAKIRQNLLLLTTTS